MSKHIKRIRTIAAALLTFASAVGSVGCSGQVATEQSQQVGSVRVVASSAQALSASAVESIEIEVYSESGLINSRFGLTRSGETWSGTIDNLPVNDAYSFLARATDAAGTVLFTGNAHGITVDPFTPTYVTLNLRQAAADPPFSNSAPFVGSMVATKAIVAPGETIALRAEATDDDGDLITYSWSGPGIFTPSDSAAPSWSAPFQEGPVELVLTVSDGKGGTSVVRLSLTVSAGGGGGGQTGAISVIAAFFEAPRVSSLSTSNGQPAAGEHVAIQASIHVPPVASCQPGQPCSFGDRLYSWQTDCGSLTTNPGGFLDDFGAIEQVVETGIDITSSQATCTVTLVTLEPRTGVANTATLTLHPTQPVVVFEQ